jgi:hypothetical protein
MTIGEHREEAPHGRARAKQSLFSVSAFARLGEISEKASYEKLEPGDKPASMVRNVAGSKCHNSIYQPRTLIGP